MPTLAPNLVRSRIAARLEGFTLTTGSLGTLREAPKGSKGFPADVPQTRSHLAFAVSLPSSDVVPVQRQLKGRPLRMAQAVAVDLLHRHRDTDAVSDEDDALAAELEVVKRLTDDSLKADGMQLTFQSSARTSNSTPENTLSVRLEFLATHHMATA